MSRTRVRRRRVALVVALTVSLAPVAGRALGTAGADSSGGRTETYVVRGGDTFWSIARTAVGPEGDPRPVVDRLRDLNPIDPGALTPGTELRVPA